MSVQNTELLSAPMTTTAAAETPDRDLQRARERSRRNVLVQVLRVAVAVVIVGGWELCARTNWLDPFFFGQPSGIATQLLKWVQNGTAQGPLWEQILVTLEETVFGFLVGVILGVI